jgi:hypothetical protein
MQQDVSHPAELCAAHHAGMIHCAAANRFTFGPTVTNQLDLHVQLPVGGDLGQQFSSQFPTPEARLCITVTTVSKTTKNTTASQ